MRYGRIQKLPAAQVPTPLVDINEFIDADTGLYCWKDIEGNVFCSASGGSGAEVSGTATGSTSVAATVPGVVVTPAIADTFSLMSAEAIEGPAATMDISDTGPEAFTHADGTDIIAGDIASGDLIRVTKTAAGYSFGGIVLADSTISYRKNISSAQILTLFSASTTLISDVGATKIIVPLQGSSASYNKINTSYATNTDVSIGNTIGAPMALLNGFLITQLASGIQGFDTGQWFSAKPPAYTPGDLLIFEPTGDPTGGDSNFDLDLFYRIVEF